ncbi:STAS/SEC14 domain-containing protein [Motiliproteus sp. SC1-56]|uniref:STAS/SEC14 domain-containing protein n=1 Tax=Motiliproteus sp. SC1-56 TaxID=2799565 RepID=UPI001A8C0F18|nr:STAS/SEC14 domain-containing protein [Motiliproteus sp. SC1-56]
MTTRLELTHGGRIMQVTQDGTLSQEAIKAARNKSTRQGQAFECALVDCRRADLSELSLIDMDTLALEFARDVPHCSRIALVRAPGRDERAYAHIANVYTLTGIETRLFDEFEQAREWLVKGCLPLPGAGEAPGDSPG